MADLRSFRILALLSSLLFTYVFCSPVNISLQTVPNSLVQTAIDSLNADSPTQHNYRGGNLISAQKLLEPNLVIYRLTLNLETICAEGLTNCPREACAIDIKDSSGDIQVDRSSIQCMYLYPQSAQEDVQQMQKQTEDVVQDVARVESLPSDNDENKQGSQNTLELDHEVEAAADNQRPETESADNKRFIAVRAPNSNYCAGCPYELNPNLPGLVAFGEQALDVMDRLGQNDFKHKLIRILRVTRVVPPGSNVVQYELITEIGESNCLKTTLIERSACSLQVNIPVRVCLVTFKERPWQQSDRQVVGNNCTEPSDLENEINAGLNPALTSNSYLGGNVARDQPERVDSVQEVIGKTAHIDQLAQEGKIGTYDSLIDQIIENPVASGTPGISITEAPFFEEISPRENVESYVSPKRGVQETNQDRSAVTEAPFVKVELEGDNNRPQVHGFVDKIKEFDDFLSDFDIPSRDMTSVTAKDNRQPVTEDIIRPQKVKTHSAGENGRVQASSVSSESDENSDIVAESERTKRSLTRTTESERTLVKELAQKAVDTLDDIDQDNKRRVVVGIWEARKERVDGFLYHLTIDVATTDCNEQNKVKSDGECLHEVTEPLKRCKVQMHTNVIDPLASARVVKSECSKPTQKGRNVRNKRTPKTLEGAYSISIDNKDVKKFAGLGVSKFSETFPGPNEPILIEILSATREIEQGILYKIQVRLGTSNCAKGTLENCQLQANSESKDCEVTALSRPWLLKDAPKITVNCDSNSRSKRNHGGKNARNRRALGAPSSINIEDIDVKNYANLGVRKFSENSEGSNESILIEIISATCQVVAGSLYNIKIRMGTSNCPKRKTDNCQLLADSERKECEVTAWSRPWLSDNSLKITVSCDSNRAKRGLRGKNYSQKMLEQSTYLKNERLFNDFIVKYNKSYSSNSERKNRFKIFHQNMMMVQELQRNEQGTAVYGATMFADLTTEEFKKNYLGLQPELRLDNEIPIPMAEIPDINIPDEYDWRNHNVVTPVKNQGQCGSCWAFSVTGNVEGQYALRHGSLLSLSEQELVDCDTLDEGCNGGLPDNAYRAIEKLGGLELESDYPYDGVNEACHFNKTEAKVKVVSAVNITTNETQMAQWLVQNGPISIGINANAMQFYIGGISHPLKFLCSPNNLDHGVLIVGYGTHTYPILHRTLPYWTIKNSWGPYWGEKGYYRVYRGDGTCGVNQMASSAVVA